MTAEAQTNSAFRIERSSEPDISAAIIEEVAAWGEAEGFPSWIPSSYTGDDSTGISRLRNDIASDALYLIWRGADAVGTLSLLENDPIFWATAGDEAMYLHRFAVRRSAAGAGRHGVEWCMAETQRRGRAYVRLDCLADNPGIRRYYESFGFAAVDEMVVNGTLYSLYEVPVNSLR